jgi:IS1 family transposase
VVCTLIFLLIGIFAWRHDRLRHKHAVVIPSFIFSGQQQPVQQLGVGFVHSVRKPNPERYMQVNIALSRIFPINLLGIKVHMSAVRVVWVNLGSLYGSTHQTPALHFSLFNNQRPTCGIANFVTDRQFFGAVNSLPTGRYPSRYIDPLTHSSSLQPQLAIHDFSCSRHLSRLGSDGRTSERGNQYQPPLRGCVPVWRVALGSLCLVCGFVVIIRGRWHWSALCGGCLILGGTILWLGNKVDCAQTQNGNENDSFHRITVTQKLLTSNIYCNTITLMANVLNTDKQIAVIGALAEGSSIRSIERITGVHRDTIMRLGVKVGKGCTALMDAKMRDLPCQYLEFDEIWGFIGKKEKHVTVDDSPELGDVWTFCAVDADTKIVPTFRCGKRDRATANAFVQDVASRMKNRVQISTDGLRAYVEAVEKSFGADVDYAQIVKTYTHDVEMNPNHRYSAPEIVTTEKKIFSGSPDISRISTSYVERLNGTTRTHMRRLTRLTLAFSKKLENFEAAVGLHFAYYNFVKRHNTLRCTPAMAAGIERSFSSVGDLVEASA